MKISELNHIKKEKYIADPEAIKGKEIAKVIYFGSTLKLFFTDGTFHFIEASDSYGSIELEAVELSGVSDWDMVEAGYITRDELDVLLERRRKASKAADEARERQLYEKLKEKYGQ